jgi:hypothetical protein
VLRVTKAKGESTGKNYKDVRRYMAIIWQVIWQMLLVSLGFVFLFF